MQSRAPPGRSVRSAGSSQPRAGGGRSALANANARRRRAAPVAAAAAAPDAAAALDSEPAAAAGGRGGGAPWEPPEIPQAVLERNAELAERLRGRLVLAPLTRGCHVPFRRLCADFGAEVTFGEMAFARGLIKGDRVERARLVRAPNEACFGVQIATNQISEGVRAAQLAKEAGASFVDLNCGCPIHEATRRGLGSALLRKPQKLARLVSGIVAGSELPVTVKIRTGEKEEKVNAREVAALMEAAGAAAGREIPLDAAERVGVFRKLISYMKEHFRDDERGRKAAFYFLPFHFAWFFRYRAFPREHYLEDSRRHPLIATRIGLADDRVGEVEASLPPLERLLRCGHEAAHLAIADALWEAPTDADALAALARLGAEAGRLEGWEAELRAGQGVASGRSGSEGRG
ncbi:tRNA-dihydrouridine synthase [Raphidocelis subcapitata]|uniref:tRNA-dihydrouridine(47) synthase [NAD(P)(+)] n=1 Tax=Raphidocelis subcapitata TaxID=307507 RepID=A0A2V0NQV1_9CHLO|nr:tRNA-dihydrouridine synthase [Raphidocelis subcapitata]|eukprot:GBF87930.1 tRNA-dihydrouridine synthase [Raphidocelis subcapitata]